MAAILFTGNLIKVSFSLLLQKREGQEKRKEKGPRLRDQGQVFLYCFFVQEKMGENSSFSSRSCRDNESESNDAMAAASLSFLRPFPRISTQKLIQLGSTNVRVLFPWDQEILINVCARNILA